MTKKPKTSKDAADKVVKNIRRKTRQTYSSEEKIRIVLAGLRGEESISVLFRREGIAEGFDFAYVCGMPSRNPRRNNNIHVSGR